MATWAGDGRGRDAGRRPRARGEVFPVLGAFIAAGLLAGAVSATAAIAGLLGRLDGHWPATAGLGAGLGAILGLFIALGRAVWRPGRPIRLREPEPPAAGRAGPVSPAVGPLGRRRPRHRTGRAEVVADEPVLAAAPETPAVARPRSGRG